MLSKITRLHVCFEALFVQLCVYQFKMSFVFFPLDNARKHSNILSIVDKSFKIVFLNSKEKDMSKQILVMHS